MLIAARHRSAEGVPLEKVWIRSSAVLAVSEAGDDAGGAELLLIGGTRLLISGQPETMAQVILMDEEADDGAGGRAGAAGRGKEE